MIKGYITNTTNAVELQDILTQLNDYGIASENIVINEDFELFSQTLSEGDTIVIYSYVGFFGGLSELFSKYIELSDRGIAIKSLSESFLSPDQLGFIKHLQELSRGLRASSTKKGLVKAISEGKKLGRPFGATKQDSKVMMAIKLRESSNMTVEEACHIAGCKIRTYYYHRGNIAK